MVMKPEVSLSSRLRDVGAAQGTNASNVQTRYALERFLHRMTLTEWRDRIALKGALIFVVHEGDIHRPTGDIDLNVDAGNDDVDLMQRIVMSACACAVDDGVVFKVSSMDMKRERGRSVQPSGRIELDAMVDGCRVRVRVDMGFGPAMSPAATWMQYPSILPDMPSSRVRVFPYSTMLAEKLHAMVRHGAETTRLRDYYDVWSIVTRCRIDGSVMAKAVSHTFAQAGHVLPSLPLDGLSDDFISMRADAWDSYRALPGLLFHPPSLADTVADIAPFMEGAVRLGAGVELGDWEPGKGWSGSPNPLP